MNIRVRTSPGVDGTLIILAAFCSRCNAEAMPMRDGTCGWCDTPIVGPPGTPAKKAPRANRKLGPPRRTDDDLVTQLRDAATRLGRPPYSREVDGRSTILRRFGSWANALSTAGLDG